MLYSRSHCVDLGLEKEQIPCHILKVVKFWPPENEGLMAFIAINACCSHSTWASEVFKLSIVLHLLLNFLNFTPGWHG